MTQRRLIDKVKSNQDTEKKCAAKKKSLQNCAKEICKTVRLQKVIPNSVREHCTKQQFIETEFKWFCEITSVSRLVQCIVAFDRKHQKNPEKNNELVVHPRTCIMWKVWTAPPLHSRSQKLVHLSYLALTVSQYLIHSSSWWNFKDTLEQLLPKNRNSLFSNFIHHKDSKFWFRELRTPKKKPLHMTNNIHMVPKQGRGRFGTLVTKALSAVNYFQYLAPSIFPPHFHGGGH